MLVSADNLDFEHSFARVFSGKQQSRWHGTTVLVVQPQPLGLTGRAPSVENPPTTLAQSGHSKRLHLALTPSTSPAKQTSFHSPVPKKCRRMRTGIEKKNKCH